MSKITILAVDEDHEFIRFLIREALSNPGYEGLFAYDGKTALELIKNRLPSHIMLPLQLPDMTAMELLQTVVSQNLSLHSILIVTEKDKHIPIEAIHLGVQDYIIKTTDGEALRNILEHVLDEYRAHRQTGALANKLKENISWLTTLSKIGKSITSVLEIDDVLGRIVEAGVNLTNAEACFLALLDSDKQQLYLRAAKNIDEEKSNTMHIKVTDPLVGSVLESGRPYRSAETSGDSNIKVVTGLLVQNLMHIPLISKGNPLGVLSVYNRFNIQTFTMADEIRLTSLADYATTALDNARFYYQAQEEIKERRRVEQALRISEERYALAMRGANDGLWDWDLVDNTIYFSPRWKAMLGFTEQEIGNLPEEWFKRVHPQDLERLKLALSAHLKNNATHFQNEHRILHKDGSIRWMLSRGMGICDTNGIVTRIAGSLTDITDLRIAEGKIIYDSLHDALTDLPNRALLLDHLRLAIERMRRREDYQFAVLLIDLDRFKNVNDLFGHLVGDQLLIRVAKLLKEDMPSTDTIARFGGDEFVILLDELKQAETANALADKILERFKTPFQINEHSIHISPSIGIVFKKPEYSSAEEVMRDVDIAMYMAKGNEKKKYIVFQPEMRERLMKRIELESELRQALEKEELSVNYQPQVSLKDERLIGFEVLARWNHSTRGAIPPIEFIPVAETTGLIIPLDRWVMRTACQQMSTWQQAIPIDPPLTISVNISSQQITHPDFIEFIARVLQETGLPAHCLKLEIIESTILYSDKETIQVLQNIQNLGVQVQIDDFGIGYSSLSYLTNFPVNALKIDQSFIRQMTDDSNNQQIVKTIISLSKNLSLSSIAEGVETIEQINQLKSLGCEYGQGFLLSVPLKRVEAEKLLERVSAGEDISTDWNQ